jgi:3-oxoacyl-[acyl-carrier-protein] synthase III
MCIRLNPAVLTRQPLSFSASAPGGLAQPSRPHGTSGSHLSEATVATRIDAVAYELGEQEMNYADMPDLAGTLGRLGLHNEPDVWGFGRYRRTEREPAELAIVCAQRTLVASGAMPQDIDAVLLCSVAFPADVRLQRAFTHRILSGLGMSNKPLLGVTMSRCATLTCGIRLADDLIASGRYRNILILSCDAIEDETTRFEPFAIFSDAAASCLLSNAGGGGFEIVRTVQASQATAADSDGPDAGGRLAARANRELAQRQVEPRSLRKVFHDNLFKPIVAMREQTAGFDSSQLFLDNINVIGHCFGCDPLINLVDFCAATPPMPGSMLGLFSGTPGVRSGVVLRVPGPTPLPLLTEGNRHAIN